jgi:cytosine/adenosine deaminase-related metal-dependent hydrolase
VVASKISRRTLVGGGSAAAVAATVGWSADRSAATAPGAGGAVEPHGPGRGRKLIKGGYVLTMDPALGDIPGGEVLIDGDTIVEVAAKVGAARAAGAEKIDATGMIVMPGMVDNHRHMWESLIRGAAADLTFDQYFGAILFGVSPRLTPDDVELGNLLGAYEALDSGITTVLDWSHGTNTAEHALAAVEGLQRSGARAVFAYGAPASNPNPDSPPAPDDVRAVHALLADDPLVDLAVAAASPEFAAFGRVAADIALARELGVGITMHALGGPAGSSPRLLDDAGLMGDDLTFIHCNAFTGDDFSLVAQHGAHISSAPEVEMQMGLGAAPLTLMLASGIHPTVSVDIVAAVGGDLFAPLRFMLQTQRMLDSPQASLPVTDRDVLPYATAHAAASLGMADRIGSLSPGKQADVALVSALDSNMFLAEPGRALVQFANPGNVDTVLVAGRVVKRHKQLVGVDLAPLRRRAREANRRLLA